MRSSLALRWFSFLILLQATGVFGSIIQFRTTRFQASESQDFGLVQLVRSGPLEAATVFCLVTNGTATADQDFTSFLTQIDFTEGQTSASFAVPLLDDAFDEPNETILLQLQSPSVGAVLGARSNALLTILDDDRGGSIRLAAAARRLREDMQVLEIAVIRSGGSAAGVTVDYSVTGRSATDGEDFEGGGGTIEFPEGVMTNLLSITILDDELPEFDEQFQIRLSNPTGGATLGRPNSTLVTILNEDAGIFLSSPTYLVSEGSSSAVITVIRTGSLAEEVSVDYATLDGSAVAGSDFEGQTNTLVFPRGTWKKFIRIPIVRDTADEANENFGIELSNPSDGLVLGEPEEASVTIVDNDTGGVIRFSSSVYLTNERTETATITVVRGRGAAGGVTVDFAVMPGTALAGEDFISQTGRLTFGPNIFKQVINVDLVHDTLIEPVETALLTLSNVTGGALLGVPSNAVLRIGNFTRPEGYAPTSLVGGTLEFIVEDGGGILSDSGDYELRLEGTNSYRIIGSGFVTNLVGGSNVITQVTNVSSTTNVTGGVTNITTTTNTANVTNLVGATTNISGIGSSSGTYFYRRTGLNLAELILSDSNSVRRQILTMTTPTGGTFHTTVSAPNSATNSFQVGTFDIITLPNFNTNTTTVTPPPET